MTPDKTIYVMIVMPDNLCIGWPFNQQDDFSAQWWLKWTCKFFVWSSRGDFFFLTRVKIPLQKGLGIQERQEVLKGVCLWEMGQNIPIYLLPFSKALENQWLIQCCLYQHLKPLSWFGRYPNATMKYDTDARYELKIL